MAKTASEWVELYTAAIESVVTNGQALAAGGRTWTKADLSTLHKLLEYWESRGVSSGSSPLRRAFVGAVSR